MMKAYTQNELDRMSEAEKNIAVSEKCGKRYLGPRYMEGFDGKFPHVVCSKGGYVHKLQNYCNNPNDIMPVAFEHRLKIEPCQIFVHWGKHDDGWCCTSNNNVDQAINASPLIAIVDCFLMMEGEW